MLTRPKNIVAHLARGTLDLTTTNTLFPNDSLGEDIPLVGFRVRVPLSIWLYRQALNEEAGAPGMGAHAHRSRDHPTSSPVSPWLTPYCSGPPCH